jgi:HSP90 family molecular chaperone
MSQADYLERMKEKQELIYFVAGTSHDEVEKSPFVERQLKKGYEVRRLHMYFYFIFLHKFPLNI